MYSLFTTRLPRMEVSAADEQYAIQDAQAGNKDASWRLLQQYAPLLQVTANRVRAKVHKMTPEQIEDLESELVLAALETIQQFDHDKYIRLSQVLPSQLKEVAGRWETALHVPKDTLKRWFKIWREAGQDVTTGAQLAPHRGMSANTFRTIHQSLEASSTEWATLPFDGDNQAADIATHRLAHLALDTLTPTEREIIEYAYGFRGDPKSDQEVADLTGSTREAVKKRRQRILEKLRPVVE